MGYISRPNVLSSWMLDFYHTIQSKVRYYLMHCVFYIYGLLMMSLLHSAIFFMFITANKYFSYHIVYAYVVSFILVIEPRGITTSNFHGYFEFFNK